MDDNAGMVLRLIQPFCERLGVDAV